MCQHASSKTVGMLKSWHDARKKRWEVTLRRPWVEPRLLTVSCRRGRFPLSQSVAGPFEPPGFYCNTVIEPIGPRPHAPLIDPEISSTKAKRSLENLYRAIRVPMSDVYADTHLVTILDVRENKLPTLSQFIYITIEYCAFIDLVRSNMLFTQSQCDLVLR